MRMLMRKAQDNPGYYSLGTVHHFILFVDFESRISHCGPWQRRLDWLASEFQGPACLQLLGARITNMYYPRLAGLGVIWGLKSGSCAWKASTIELSLKAAVFLSACSAIWTHTCCSFSRPDPSCHLSYWSCLHFHPDLHMAWSLQLHSYMAQTLDVFLSSH